MIQEETMMLHTDPTIGKLLSQAIEQIGLNFKV